MELKKKTYKALQMLNVLFQDDEALYCSVVE